MTRHNVTHCCSFPLKFQFGFAIYIYIYTLYDIFYFSAELQTFLLQVFRLLRSLRPLRVINRAPGLKLVVQTLLSSLRPIGNIVLICCTFFIIFGILGVQVSYPYALAHVLSLPQSISYVRFGSRQPQFRPQYQKHLKLNHNLKLLSTVHFNNTSFSVIYLFVVYLTLL
jgi:hypothetical protein